MHSEYSYYIHLLIYIGDLLLCQDARTPVYQMSDIRLISLKRVCYLRIFIRLNKNHSVLSTQRILDVSRGEKNIIWLLCLILNLCKSRGLILLFF